LKWILLTHKAENSSFRDGAGRSGLMASADLSCRLTALQSRFKFKHHFHTIPLACLRDLSPRNHRPLWCWILKSKTRSAPDQVTFLRYEDLDVPTYKLKLLFETHFSASGGHFGLVALYSLCSTSTSHSCCPTASLFCMFPLTSIYNPYLISEKQ